MTNEIISRVLVFKTNIRNETDVQKITPVLQAEKHVAKWNVDLDDVDHILRIESNHPDSTRIIAQVRKAGYHCEELPD